MALITKMAIMGVRSFDPDTEQIISFHRPLTLIVGNNGAGKTTIIECIKMALTGQLPPDADKGKNFIHDPKVKSSADTKASIRMQFRTAEGKKIETSRNFKLQYKTSKAKGVSKQQLSYTMHNTTLTSVDSSGKPTAISFRTQVGRTRAQLRLQLQSIISSVHRSMHGLTSDCVLCRAGGCERSDSRTYESFESDS